MVQGTFNSLLPQSTFKVWGVQPNTFKILNIFEYPKREERVIQSAHSMQKVNEIIAEFYSFKEVNFIEYDQEVEITNGTFDQQIINLKHHYPNLTIKGQVNLVDYSYQDNRLQHVNLKKNFGLFYVNNFKKIPKGNYRRS